MPPKGLSAIKLLVGLVTYKYHFDSVVEELVEQHGYKQALISKQTFKKYVEFTIPCDLIDWPNYVGNVQRGDLAEFKNSFVEIVVLWTKGSSVSLLIKKDPTTSKGEAL